MTVRLTRESRIGKYPAIELRDLLRRCDKELRSDWLENRGYSPAASEEILSTLVDCGLVELKSNAKRDSPFQCYLLTEQGHALVRATAAQPITKSHAERTLTEFLERVGEVNRDDRFLVRIVTVVVFGSFLAEVLLLSDLDLACEYEPKIAVPEERMKVYREHFVRSGRPFQNMLSPYTWPEDEVKLFIKRRQRTISLQPMNSFLEMPKDRSFRYQVLLGDPQRVAALLENSRSDRSK